MTDIEGVELVGPDAEPDALVVAASPTLAEGESEIALTARELEVLALLAEGASNKLIARRLEISEKTVKSHLTRIFRELGVTDRTQAALWAERHGLD